MQAINPSLKLFINLVKILTVSSRRWPGGLDGFGFSEFAILFYLNQARDNKLRRVDLADKLGLTASGVTRILAPMEKIGLIKREDNPRDARVSYVILTASGKRNLNESMEDAELLAEEVFPKDKIKKLESLSETLIELGATIK